jgi:hypothetical protein
MTASNHRRWLVIGVLATLGLVLAAVWPRGGSEDVAEDIGDASANASDTPAAGDTNAAPSAVPTLQVDAGTKGRRVTPGCEPAEESLKYEKFIDKRALLMLSWYGMPERTNKLKIPVRIVRIEDGAVGVRFPEFPMKEQFLSIWLGSGHIKPAPDDVFPVDPCSATFVKWSSPEPGDAERVESLNDKVRPAQP